MTEFEFERILSAVTAVALGSLNGPHRIKRRSRPTTTAGHRRRSHFPRLVRARRLSKAGDSL